MFTNRTDLQLERDTLGRFLPWLIAFMVYLSILALAGMLALDDIALRWEKGISDTLTVQLSPQDNGDNRDAMKNEVGKNDAKILEDAIDILRSTPGVSNAEIYHDDKVLLLLEPWLGKEVLDANIPLPKLIDVELEEGVVLDMNSLEARLKLISPNILVDDHGIWLGHLIDLIQTVKVLALTVLLFIALATTGTVIFATRSGLAIHHEAIEVLHLIGAQDNYIAKQFASRALLLGLRGGLIGLLLALPTIWGIGAIASFLQSGFFPEFSLRLGHWVTLVFLPVIVALIAMVSARLTVMKSLAKML